MPIKGCTYCYVGLAMGATVLLSAVCCQKGIIRSAIIYGISALCFIKGSVMCISIETFDHIPV